MALLAHDLLSAAAARAPARMAVTADGWGRTFADLDRDADRVAGTLQDMGVRRGDRVALMMDNGPAYVAAFFGILRAGAVYAPVPPSAKADRLAYVLADVGARVLIAPRPLAAMVGPAAAGAAVLWADGPDFAQRLAPSRPRPADPGLTDGDLAVIAYTSGATGRPKGAMLTHANLVSTTRAIAGRLGVTADDVVLCALPLGFGYGLSHVLMGALVGYTLVLERSFAFPAATLARVAEHRVTGLPGVPTLFARLLALEGFRGARLGSLRFLTNAAAAIPVAHVRRLMEAFPAAAFHSMYGATECSTRIAMLDPAEAAARPGSVGVAIPGCRTRLIGEDGAPVARGAVGELLVQGINVMRGYWSRPAETGACFIEAADGRWWRTGDLFREDADGFLHVVGRADDVFKCRGEKVSPREVESVICELAAVAEAVVVGAPDPDDGMAVHAHVVPQDGAAVDPIQVIRHCRARLEGHLVPKVVRVTAALPRTDTGKVRRSELVSAG